MFPAWAGNICLIFWSDATYQLFQIKFGPSLVLLGGEVQYCSHSISKLLLVRQFLFVNIFGHFSFSAGKVANSLMVP